MSELIPPPLPLLLQFLLIVLVLPAAVLDFRSRRIPNWLCVAGFAAGVAANTALGGLGGLKASLAGFGVAFGLYFVLYLLHAMGAGDVKLMGAAGAVTGLHTWLAIFAATAVFGMMAAPGLALAKGRFLSTLWNVGYLVRELLSLRAPYMRHEQLDVKNPRTLRLPHGVSIAAGAAAILILAWWKAAARAG
ncbi:MAG: A24 family peptidase [Bryobacteraceae bacterium]